MLSDYKIIRDSTDVTVSLLDIGCRKITSCYWHTQMVEYCLCSETIIILLRGDVLDRKTSYAPPLFIEVPVSIQKVSDHACECQWYRFFSLFLRSVNQILELFRQVISINIISITDDMVNKAFRKKNKINKLKIRKKNKTKNKAFRLLLRLDIFCICHMPFQCVIYHFNNERHA